MWTEDLYNLLQIQGEQIQIQIKQRVDERFNSAINLLGSSETSARTGAVYALHELALEVAKSCVYKPRSCSLNKRLSVVWKLPKMLLKILKIPKTI
jgi:hypothetical protein